MYWKVKGLLQKCLSTYSWGRNLNDRLQQKFGALRNFDDNIRGKLDDWKLSLSYLRNCDFRVNGSTVFEIGTGWYPTLPICFSLAGAERVITYDIVRHVDAGLTLRLLHCLRPHLGSIAEASGAPIHEICKRYDRLLDTTQLDKLFEHAHIEYFAPADSSSTKLPNETIDLVYSNSVMEHVPPPVISEIMRETTRILRSRGLALHNIACNDHYAHADPGISFVNFLKYDESQWDKWNNALQYQNRLRALEFLALAKAAGLEIIYKRTSVRPGTTDAIRTMKIAPQFRHFSTEELVTTTLDFVARKP